VGDARRIAALVVVMAATSACGGPSEREVPSGADAGPPVDGDKLVVGTPADVDGLNPLILNSVTAQDVADQVFWPLAQANPDFLTFRPGLADEWSFADDSLSLTFRLNPGATWHDGRPLTARDVAFAVGLCKDERVPYSAVRWLDRIGDVVAVDSLTVRFEFTERYPYQLMDAVVCRPLPRHLLEGVDPARLGEHPFSRDPVGNGPFRFVRWVPQQSVELAAYDGFFRGRPHLDGVIWRVIPDWTSLVTQIANGDVDLVVAVLANYVPELERDPDLVLHAFPGRRYTYIAWNLRDPLFADRRVRRALTMAIDRQGLVDALLYGRGEVLHGPFPKILWAYDPQLRGLSHDRAAAGRLLDEAGWRDTDGDGIRDREGRPFRFDLVTNADNTMRMDIAVAVQSQLREVGVDVRPRGLEFVSFQERLTGKDFQAAVAGWNIGIKVDLTTFWHSNAIEDQFNFISYANPAVDALIDSAAVTLDPDAARPLWSRAQQVIADDAGYTFLFHQYDVHALDRRFRGVEMNPYGWQYNLHEWWVPAGLQRF
jgi:peptide/nickel transport system substrate-binding protein